MVVATHRLAIDTQTRRCITWIGSLAHLPSITNGYPNPFDIHICAILLQLDIASDWLVNAAIISTTIKPPNEVISLSGVNLDKLGKKFVDD